MGVPTGQPPGGEVAREARAMRRRWRRSGVGHRGDGAFLVWQELMTKLLTVSARRRISIADAAAHGGAD